MNNGWRFTTLQEFVDRGEAELKTGPFGTQLHASDYVERGTPVINVRNIGLGTIVPEKLEYIADNTVQRLASHLLRADDIVFGRKGAVERHAFLKSGHEGWFQGSDCLRLRVSGSNLVPRFLSYCFLTGDHKRWMNAFLKSGHEGWFQGSDCLRLRVSGSNLVPRFLSYCFLTGDHKRWMMNQCSHCATMASLNQGITCRIPLRLPPQTEQRRIASVLSAYDDLIENNTRRIKILEDMAQMIYREWFFNFRFPGHENARTVESELGPIPEAWTPTRLGDLCSEKRRGVHPNEVDPGTPYIGLEHLPRKSIALGEWGRAGDVGSTKLRFDRGDILFGKIRPYFHKVCVAPVDGVASSDAIVIVPSETGHFGLVLCCVSSEDFVSHATQTSQGTKMPRANWDVLIRYPLPLPTLR